ncbi:hypothetical protein [Streptomyces sp. CA-111067]|uniref:hypothetical protein n=1 Tax=Streptomyces sp. CA-111067 TaxID=3240046 RepID=UPI003D951EA4
MNGGLPPLRERHMAAVFIVVMYAGLGVLLAGLLALGLGGSSSWGGVAAAAGGIGGAAFGLWMIHRTPEEERMDDSPYS